MSICGCRGLWTSTLGVPLLMAKLRYASPLVSATLKASRCASLPSYFRPEGKVTVTVVGGTREAEPVPPPNPEPPPPPETNRFCSVFGSYLAPIPARSPDTEWHVLHFPCPLKYSSPAFASPMRILIGAEDGRPRIFVGKLCRNVAMSEISVSPISNLGIPLSMRPFRITDEISSPCWSSRTSCDRTKLGPVSPPLASEPCQKPQLTANTCFPC